MAAVVSLRPLYLIAKLQPWGLLHLAALPIAGRAVLRATLGRGTLGTNVSMVLLGTLYLGWLVQADLIQAQFDYHMAPTILLALTLVCATLGSAVRPLRFVAALAVFAVIAVALQPACSLARLALWPQCLSKGGTATLRDRLALFPTSPNSVDLDRVADFLRGQNVGDRDVLCYDLSTTQLQTMLGIRPATRQLYPRVNLYFLSRHRQVIRAELRAGPQRFIVTESEAVSMTRADAHSGPTNDPHSPDAAESAQPWPYSLPVVFRAGRYAVHDARAEKPTLE